MEIKIDKDGYLSIKKAGKLRFQHCLVPSYDSGRYLRCGDWCPAFWYDKDNAILHLCTMAGSINITDVIDERE